MWVTSDRVGEKINQVYEEHDATKDKVLLLFSVNRQRAYCALAEMDGPWEKSDTPFAGWHEKQGNFDIVG